MGKLDGKIAIVTGAASRQGIGFATARRLAEDGAKVVITDIDGAEVEARAAELTGAGFPVASFAQDVTDEASWDETIGRTEQRFGGLDILVNNAGICILSRLVAMSLADFQRQITVNLNSVFLGCRAAARIMLKQGRGGAIVNISSVSALVTGPGSSAYTASKAGVHMMTKTIAIELAPQGIRVNSVHPGVTMTEMVTRSLAESPESLTQMQGSIPLARGAEPREIAAMVAFLASEDASYCVGGSYLVDGGVTTQ